MAVWVSNTVVEWWEQHHEQKFSLGVSMPARIVLFIWRLNDVLLKSFEVSWAESVKNNNLSKTEVLEIVL